MLKRILRFLMRKRTGYTSPNDHFLAKVRKQYRQPSPSQVNEVQQHQEIVRKRDRITKDTLATPWRDA